MKFNAPEWLARYGGDAEKALNALHQEVEDRESDNQKAREDRRNAEQELLDAKATIQNLEKQINEKPAEDTTAELARYRAIGKIEELEEEVPALREQLDTAQDTLLNLGLKQKLREAGVGDKYLDSAVTLLRASDKYFKGEEDAEEVELDVDNFKKDNDIFFTSDGIDVLEGRGKGADTDESFKGVADSYVKDRFDVPRSS